jgi:hypothetical protein
MTKEPFIRDERTVAVADRSYRLACLVLTFGLLIDVAVRGLMLREAPWDLLALVVLASGVATVYQRVKHVQVLPRWWSLWLVVISTVVASAIAVAVQFLKR